MVLPLKHEGKRQMSDDTSPTYSVSNVERFDVHGKVIENVEVTTKRIGDRVYVSIDNGKRMQNYVMSLAAFEYLAKAELNGTPTGTNY